MSLLLKAGVAVGRIEPLTFSNGHAPGFGGTIQTREDELAACILDLNAQLSANKEDLPKLLEHALEEGRLKGIREKNDANAARLACLQRGTASALSALADSLKALRASSALIAEVAIERLFGDPALHSEHVQRSLLCQLHRLEQDTLLTIRVSSDDVDETALQALKFKISPHAVSIDDGLKTGECVIDCQLGHIDLGLATQQATLSALLRAGFEEAIR